MKKIFFLIVFILSSIPICAQSFALQSGYPKQFGDGLEWYFVATAQDSGSISANIMTELVNYDSDLGSYPLSFDLTVDTLTTDNEILAVYLQGMTGRGSWFNIDTLVVADTLNGSHTTLGADNTVQGTMTLNGLRAPNYRLLIVASHASGNTYNVKCSIYAYKGD